VSAVDDLRQARKRARLPFPGGYEFLYPLGTVIALLVGWYLWVSVGHVPEYLFPSISEVWHKLLSSHELLQSAWDTIQIILRGYLFAVVLGIGLAALVVSVRPFEIGVYPIIISTQFVPLVALAPLFVIWFGFGDTSQMAIITLFSYFPIFMSTLAGLRMLQLEKTYLARAAGAGSARTFFSIRLPNALPQTFVGLKIGITSAVIGAVVAEFTIGSRGLGSIIIRSTGYGDSTTLVAGVLYLGLIGGLLFGGVGLVERFVIPWYFAMRKSAQRAMG
jgi:NitT/TauT family transport system permease protein